MLTFDLKQSHASHGIATSIYIYVCVCVCVCVCEEDKKKKEKKIPFGRFGEGLVLSISGFTTYVPHMYCQKFKYFLFSHFKFYVSSQYFLSFHFFILSTK